jgi:hypothetical protein
MEASPQSRLALAMTRRDRRPSILARGDRRAADAHLDTAPRRARAGVVAGRHRVGPGRDRGADRAPVPFPQVRTALWRDPELIAAGQWWWLVVYLGCGVIGQIFGYLWEPPDAGASVAGAGLLGAVSAWLLSPAGPRQLQVRVWGVLWPLVGIALTLKRDQHGPRCWSAWPWAPCCCGGTGAARSPTWSPPPVPGSRHPQSAADRERGWALASTTSRPGGATLGGERPHGLEGGLR